MYAVAVSDEEIGAETRFETRRDEVIEANKALLEFLGRIAVETCKYDCENGREILLDDAAAISY